MTKPLDDHRVVGPSRPLDERRVVRPSNQSTIVDCSTQVGHLTFVEWFIVEWSDHRTTRRSSSGRTKQATRQSSSGPTIEPLDDRRVDETMPPWWGLVGDGRKFDGEVGNVCIKGDVSAHTSDACAALVAMLGLSLSRTSDCTMTFGRGTFCVFVLVVGDNLVDSWYRSRTLGHVVWESEDLEIHPSETHGLWMRFFINWRLYGFSSRNPEAGWTLVLEPGGWTDFLPGTRRLDGLSSWNPEAGWTFVLEPGGWMDLRPGTRRMVELLFRNLMVVWTFKGTFSYIFSTRSRLCRLPLGRLTSGTRCVRFVNLEYRDASHSTFRRWVTREFYPRDNRSLLWTRRFNSWILGSNETVVLFQNPEMLLGPEGRFWSPEAALDPEDLEVVLNLEVARDPEVVWEPGGFSRPEGHFEPGGRLGTRRKSFGNPEVPLDSEVILNPKVSFGPRGRFNPEVSRDPEIVLNPKVSFGPGGRFEPRGCLGTRRFLLDPEVILNPKALRSFQDQETAWGPEGTVLRLPRQDYSQYLLGFRIMPLGSWPLSSSYAVFYFCRMSLSGLEGAGLGVMTQVPGFAAFHIWRSRLCSLPESKRGSSSGSTFALYVIRSLRESKRGTMQGSDPELLSTGTWRQASPGQDIAQLILVSEVLLRFGPCLNLEENKFPQDRPGSSRRFKVLDLLRDDLARFRTLVAFHWMSRLIHGARGLK
ncbi:hypothetical protein F2Q69_00006401 [Brassica cretica]|uniref:Uncharacterized protein n=1 Tax=Brassica cretica TaxID=69181 RepID=A0A8S9PDE3_BRACR|nr:hypothetical protein F2Q69_00006401 [Brassica cretica]